MRIIQFIFLFKISLLLVVGAACSRLNFSVVDPPRFTIASPAVNSEYGPETQTMYLSGSCTSADKSVLILEPIREVVNCVDKNWSHELDISMLPEGSFTVKVGAVDGSVSYSHTAIKRFYPSYLTVAKAEKKLSVVNDITHSVKSDPHQVLAYASDEACGPANCSTVNITLRFKDDNYKTLFQITRDLLIPASQPLITFLPSGDLRILYVSSETPTGVKNLYYRDFFIQTKTASPAVKVTNASASISNPRIVRTSSGISHLFYLSNEYCTANGCSVQKVSWRTSTDNFQGVTYPAPSGGPSQCAVGNLLAAIQRPTGSIHLAYSLASSGSCSEPISTVEHLRFQSGNWISTKFQENHMTSSQLAVDDAGRAFLFVRTTWNTGGCPSWTLMFRSSIDGFASHNSPAGGCGHLAGYPGEMARPGYTISDSGDVQFVYERSGNYPGANFSLHVSSSSNLFASSTEIFPSEYGGYYNYPSIVETSEGWDVFVMSTSSGYSGLHRIVMSSNPEKAFNLSGSVSSTIKPVALENGKIGFISSSPEWCDKNNCDNMNFLLQSADGSLSTWLTKIASPKLELGSPSYVHVPSGADQFFYSSNEAQADRLLIYHNSEADNFTSRTVLPILGPDTGAGVADLGVDASGTVHLSTYQTPSGNNIYRNSLDGFSAGTKVNGDNVGATNFQLKVRHDGASASLYGATGGAWRGRARWSIDSFAADLFALVDSTVKYTGRTIAWNPADQLEVFMVSDQNADSRADLVRMSSADSFAAMTILSTSSSRSLCNTGNGLGINVKYDSNGLAYVFYSAKDDGSNICKLYLKRSDDWTRSWKIYHEAIVSYSAVEIFLKDPVSPTVCARSAYSLHCFETSALTRTLD
jgi:hypothetical protein